MKKEEYNSEILSLCNQVNATKFALNPEKYNMVTLFFPRCLKINPVTVVDENLEDCLHNALTIVHDFFVGYNYDTKRMIQELPKDPVTGPEKAKRTRMKKIIKDRVYMFLDAYFTINNKPEEYMAVESTFVHFTTGGFTIPEVLEVLRRNREERESRKQKTTKIVTLDCLGKYELPQAM